MRKQNKKAMAALLAAVFLCGCQAAPNKPVIVSKNDGSFDVNVVRSATHPTGGAGTASEPEESLFRYQDDFTSTDGSVAFHMDIQEHYPDRAMPVVEVAPHFFTGEDAKRIAHVLFAERDYYEAEPLCAPVYSKAELQDRIARWTTHTGNAGMGPGDYSEIRSVFLEKYAVLLETAPEENPHIPCKWTFQKSSNYINTPEDAAKMDTSGDNDEIQATVKVGEIPYLFWVSTRNRSDFKISNLFAYPDHRDSPATADYYIFRQMLCQTEKPSEEDLEKVKARAEALLKQMDVGDWVVDQCYLKEIENYDSDSLPEYTIVVTAVPGFRGAAALRLPQYSTIKSEASYASNYYLTDVQFAFNISGELVNLEMRAPVDVVSVINEDVQTLSKETLMELAKDYSTYSDYATYGEPYEIEYTGEKLECRVTIGSAEYGLARVKAPNTDDSYYYVPAILFQGTAESFGKDSGSLYSQGRPVSLLLNAVDGTVINTTNA